MSNDYQDPQRISTHGDDLERHWAGKILNSIPSYATIWETYIGNDGHQCFLPMPGADKSATESRERLWERLYTLFESLALTWELESQFPNHSQVIGYIEYAWNLNAWTAFYAHLGRVADMAKDVSEQLHDHVSDSSVRAFFEGRNIVLHGPKVPMCWVENVLAVPSLGERPKQWHDKMRWKDLSHEQFNFLTDQVSTTLRALEIELERFLSQVLSSAPFTLGLKPVQWNATGEDLPRQNTLSIPFSSTQSCAPYDASGVYPTT